MHPQQAADHGQIVIDPVVDLVQKNVFFAKGLIELHYFNAQLGVGVFQLLVGLGELPLEDGGIAFLQISLAERP